METDNHEKQEASPAHWFNLCCCPCSAIDACESSNGGCSSKAECRRTTPGNRVCVCSTGYTGDGIVCIGKHVPWLMHHSEENHRREVSFHPGPEEQLADTISPDAKGIFSCHMAGTTWQTMHLQQRGVTPNLIKQHLPLARITPSPAAWYTHSPLITTNRLLDTVQHLPRSGFRNPAGRALAPTKITEDLDWGTK